jgi:ubiquinone/menaquinone biosynthesis C-methylase UbiE
VSDHERHNREFWDADADDYQAEHADALTSTPRAWGVWRIPDVEVGAVGDARGLDVLELGCGGAQWSVALAADGARVVALDQSRGQLRHARAAVGASGVSVPLLCASGEAIPCRAGSFDLVFCDHGAMSFCEPERSVAEVARVSPGGCVVPTSGCGGSTTATARARSTSNCPTASGSAASGATRSWSTT